MREQGESRHFVFTRNVRVAQGDITLTTDRLDAYYSDGASQPERLVATGNVRVRQQDWEGRCDEAVYLRSEQRVVCSGAAELVQGCDRVRGREIAFDLERDRVRVSGAASLVIHPGDADETACEEQRG